MATYTDNYNLVKPTMAETADIRTINGNMDSVDNIMHATQVSLAPAYDRNETYNTGDIVMYEFLMYECLDDDVTGTWDATKWQRTTAGEHGGGGGSADYVELTQAEYNALTPAEKMNGTMYFITDASGGGGGGGSSEIYDNTEKVVGTWFGETLYEKTVTFTAPSGNGNHTIMDLSGWNMSKLIDIESNGSYQNYLYTFPTRTAFLSVEQGVLKMNVADDDWGGYEINATIKYTKSST